MNQLDTNLWGMGWNSLKYGEKYHGKAGLFDVSKIYSKSKLGALKICGIKVSCHCLLL